jgi:hypothetical protein
MASTTATLRHEGTGAHGWILAAMAMLALALGCGYTLAMGELVGLYVALSLLCGFAVLSISAPARCCCSSCCRSRRATSSRTACSASPASIRSTW